jgi:general stress protein 26
MSDRTVDRNKDREVPLEKKLDDLYHLIDGIETAMLTTRRFDGHLVSRPMKTQRRTAGTDLWFISNGETHKFDELANDPHVNVAFYKDRTREWVSVSGTAILSRDRSLIRGLYRADWRAWLGDDGGVRDGGPDDPRIVLILVEAHSVTYSKNDRPFPMVLFEVARGIITGEPPKAADLRELGSQELRRAMLLEQSREIDGFRRGD